MAYLTTLSLPDTRTIQRRKLEWSSNSELQTPLHINRLFRPTWKWPSKVCLKLVRKQQKILNISAAGFKTGTFQK
jgi:hypothetical protein